MNKKLALGMCLAVVMATGVVGQQPSLVLTSDQSTVAPGDIYTLTITTTGGTVQSLELDGVAIALPLPSCQGVGNAQTCTYGETRTAGTSSATHTATGTIVSSHSASASVTVTLPPPPPPPTCTFTVSPSSVSVASSGASVALIVDASDASCAWSVSSGQTWTSLVPTTGTGSGGVTLIVDPNTGAARTGFVVVAGRTVDISQAAQPQPPSGDFWSRWSGQALKARRYKTQAEINAESEKNPNVHVTYDAAEDAARVEFVNDSVGDGSLPNQVRPKFGSVIATGTVTVCAEFKWHPHYADATYRAGLNVHKWLQHFNSAGSGGLLGDKTRFEPRLRFDLAAAGKVAKRDTRVYKAGATGTSIPMNFQVAPSTWYRWCSSTEFVDADTLRYSEWMGVRGQALTPLVTNYQADFNGGGGYDQFWFEYNTSQARSSSAGPLVSWFRDLLILRNANVAAVIADAAAQ